MRKYYGVLFLLVAVLLSGCSLVKGPVGENGNGNGEEKSVVEEWKGSLKDMVAKNVSMRCDYNDGQGNGWTSYVKGKNYYAEGVGDEKKGYVLMKDTCMWSWSDGEEGVKICWDEEDLEGSMWENPGQYGNSEYNCVPTVVADSKFEVPKGVSFIDMNQVQQMYGVN